MLGKLYITSNSDTEKLHTVVDLAAEAIDIKIASDATTRNALNKLYMALTKAAGDSSPAKKTTGDNAEMREGLTIADEETAPAPTEVGEDTKMEDVKDEEMTQVGDTVLEELLEDEEEL